MCSSRQWNGCLQVVGYVASLSSMDYFPCWLMLPGLPASLLLHASLPLICAITTSLLGFAVKLQEEQIVNLEE